MATQKPLVLVGTRLQELAATDVLFVGTAPPGDNSGAGASTGFVANGFLSLSKTTTQPLAGPVGFGGGTWSIGNGVASGFYGDGSNLALRLPSSSGQVYIQAAGGTANYLTISPTAATISVPLNQTIATIADKAGLFGQWTINGITGQRGSGVGTGGQLILTVANDSADLSTGVGYGSSAAYIQYSYGGTNANGQRYAMFVTGGQVANVNATAYAVNNPQEIGAIYATAAVSANLTCGGTTNNPVGAVIPLFSEAVIGANAGPYKAVTAFEVETNIASGAQVKYAASIHLPCKNAQRGYYYDCAIGISGFGLIGASNAGWNTGILFGPMSGGQPFTTDATLIGTSNTNTDTNGATLSFPCTVSRGIDLSAYTVTNEVLKWQNGSIMGSGSIYLPKSNSAVVFSNSTWAVGDNVATGYFGDGSNLALRLPASNGTVFLQSSGGATTYMTVNSAAATVNVPLGLKSFTVATLPAAGTAGRVVFCSNARMFNGAGALEVASSGTGGAVNDNGSAWKIAGTNVTASA